MDSRRHFAPGLNRNGERGIPKSVFYSFNFTYECQLDEGTKKNVVCFQNWSLVPFSSLNNWLFRDQFEDGALSHIS